MLPLRTLASTVLVSVHSSRMPIMYNNRGEIVAVLAITGSLDKE